MKTKHTPGPWRVSLTGPRRSEISTPGNPYVLATVYEDNSNENARDNAERIVACVNALEGLNEPIIIREQIRVMRAALAEIASIPKHGEPEEDGSPHAQDWDDNGGYYAIKALHNAIDKARAVIDATREG